MKSVSEKVIEKNNMVRQYRCDTWETFISLVRDVPYVVEGEGRSFGRGAIFRGHANPSWTLSSKLERNLLQPTTIEKEGKKFPLNLRKEHPDGWYENACSSILHRFKYLSKGLPGIDPAATDDELWAVGRHFGLLTPLLDWSGSPYVAAFFAFAEINSRYEFFRPANMFPKGGMVHVWGLRLFDDLEVKKEFEIINLAPPFASRHRAQSGLFTKLLHKDFLDVKEYLESRGLAHYLEVYELPHEIALKALRDLDLMNINLASLYPDLHGAAVQANINEDSFRLAMITYDFFQKENAEEPPKKKD